MPESGAIQQAWAGEKIKFGGLSLLIGTNASGKSNIRDALRFIHGISRGYTLADVLEKNMLRAGVAMERHSRRRAGNRHQERPSEEHKIHHRHSDQLLPEDGGGEAEYSITVDAGDKNRPPVVAEEWLKLSKHDHRTFTCNVGKLGEW